MKNDALSPEDRAAIERYNATTDLGGCDELWCNDFEERVRALIRLKYLRPAWLTDGVVTVLRRAKQRQCYSLLYHLAEPLSRLGCDDWIVHLCIGTGGSVDPYLVDMPRTPAVLAEMLIDNLLVHDVESTAPSRHERG